MDPVRVVVVEDEPLYRDLLATALVSRIPDTEVVGSFGSAEEALEVATELRPDVLLTDIDLGDGMAGPALGVEMRRRTTTRGVVLLSNLSLPAVLTTLPADVQGGWSYLLKTSVTDVPMLGNAIAAAAEGQIMLDEHLVDDLVPETTGPLGRLTPRQLEVLARMARGWSNRRVADDLHLTVRSVESVVSNIIANLDVGFTEDGYNARVACVLVYIEHTIARSTPRLR